MPDPAGLPNADALESLVDDQALAVLAAIDDLRQDLPGSVHSARVSVRKLRSTLAVFRPALDRQVASELVELLRWFGGRLGEARDAQVVRSRLVGGIERLVLPATSAEELLNAFDQDSAGAWDRARSALKDPMLGELVLNLERARLGSLTNRSTPGAAVVLPRIATSLEILLGKADAALQGRPDTARLHRLRKRVKHVRFAVESARDDVVRQLPTGSGAGRVADALEALQDLLGEYRDAVATSGVLERLALRAPDLSPDLTTLIAEETRSITTAQAGLPDGVGRVREAVTRLERRTPGVHLSTDLVGPQGLEP